MEKFVPVNLRCEYEKNPLGVQKRHPLISWQIEAESYSGGIQSAYQIIAASSEKNLKDGIYDLWDTGKVKSGLSHGILYQGAPLYSAERVYWTVRIWDQKGETSEFGEPAWFEMGLLEPKDWKGNWMSFLGGMIGNGILMRYYFKGKKREIRRARAYVACTGYYEFYLNGRRIGTKVLDPASTDYSKTVLYSAYDVTEEIRADENTVGFMLGTGWAGLPKILLQLNIEYSDGSVQEEYTDRTDYKHDAWFACWLQELVTGFGMFRYGEKTGKEEWITRAGQILDLLLEAPRTKGMFPVICYLEEDGTETWLRDDGWAGYRNEFHTLQMSYTAWLAILWA